MTRGEIILVLREIADAAENKNPCLRDDLADVDQRCVEALIGAAEILEGLD